MNEVKIAYYVIRGRCEPSPWIEWSILLTDEEMAIYNRVLESDIDLDDVSELDDALSRAYDDVLAYEKECAEDWGDEWDDDWELRVRFVNPK